MNEETKMTIKKIFTWFLKKDEKGESSRLYIAIALVFITIMVIFGALKSGKENVIANTDVKIDSALVVKYETIRNQIETGDFDNARLNIKDLVHPSGETSSYHKNWIEQYNYNEYWTLKRTELRTLLSEKEKNIMGEKLTKNEVPLKTQNEAVNLKSTSKELQNKTASLLDSKYLGLYVLQSENNNTQFFKFTNKQTSGELNIIYQDNIGGNVRIENYTLKSFNEGSGEVILESKKNSNNITKVFFKRDPESSNGYKLVDSDGNSYPFVSK
jgi:hypothetical protein